VVKAVRERRPPAANRCSCLWLPRHAPRIRQLSPAIADPAQGSRAVSSLRIAGWRPCHFPTHQPELQSPPSPHSMEFRARPTPARLPSVLGSHVGWGRPMNWATNSVAGPVVELSEPCRHCCQAPATSQTCDGDRDAMAPCRLGDRRPPRPSRPQSESRASWGPAPRALGVEVASRFNRAGIHLRAAPAKARARATSPGAARRRDRGPALAQLHRAAASSSTASEGRGRWWPNPTRGISIPAKGAGPRSGGDRSALALKNTSPPDGGPAPGR